MKRNKLRFQIGCCVLTACVLTACNDDKKTSTAVTEKTPTPITDTSCSDSKIGKELGITAIPSSFDSVVKDSFCKYMAYETPNKGKIDIVAQTDISDEQMIRAYNILGFFLENVEGSEYGADKSGVANRMSDNGARLLLMNGSDGESEMPDVNGQPLYDTELVVEGSVAYMNNDYENHRDAAFEEILHLVHDYGIGTSGPDAAPGSLPQYTAAIDTAQQNATANVIWPSPHASEDIQSWIDELTAEGSLSQEYLAAVIDSYYGYWGAFQENSGGMWGIYAAKTRADIAQVDTEGLTVVQQFFSPIVTYTARIDASLDGDFSMTFDVNTPYTHKSQYLVNATLTGTNNSNLIGNAHDNYLSGNSGSNTLDGKEGTDVAFFAGDLEQYSVNFSSDAVLVQDSIADRHGITTLINMEVIQFSDKFYMVEDGELTEISEDNLNDGAQNEHDCQKNTPLRESAGQLNDISEITELSGYAPFTKLQTAYGLQLFADGRIEDSFLQNISQTTAEIFTNDSISEQNKQSEVIEHLYRYKALLPVIYGGDEDITDEVMDGYSEIVKGNSVCDIIMSNPSHNAAMEVVEHVLHQISVIGLSRAYPKKWGISTDSELYNVMQTAIEKEIFKIEGYSDIGTESPSYLRILLQEFAYWLITTEWNLQVPYGPGEPEEWTLTTSEELATQLPSGKQLLEDTVNQIMTSPSIATLEQF